MVFYSIYTGLNVSSIHTCSYVYCTVALLKLNLVFFKICGSLKCCCRCGYCCRWPGNSIWQRRWLLGNLAGYAHVTDANFAFETADRLGDRHTIHMLAFLACFICEAYVHVVNDESENVVCRRLNIVSDA